MGISGSLRLGTEGGVVSGTPGDTVKSRLDGGVRLGVSLEHSLRGRIPGPRARPSQVSASIPGTGSPLAPRTAGAASSEGTV